MTHLHHTFAAPGFGRDPTTRADMKVAVEDLGFEKTGSMAQHNALFAGWAWWNHKHGYRLITWDDPEFDVEEEGKIAKP